MDGPLYVAVSIGCLECGNESWVAGVFRSEEEARARVVGDEEFVEADENAYGSGQLRIFKVDGFGLASAPQG